mmetsp:Transcript_33416/g.105563  ORF Transcript_33416/g.105563 Transcript_33416/m.105563 type:complete len:158 (-) Transcript_33416:151-624(-)|eukprot:CAMPEP_0118878178 /NCGR_PEP_ID=MMETSP1163-20130328/18170_1 /TAXON_ID=124430 /ORGANISM="Phaeomonas parva, Strain CCMP2877" /LENGTH=157 /DNA_ID=CAMNT_0006813979 /DNA_START=109 /DNA_END=582 /DNA_ORIENTATION=+
MSTKTPLYTMRFCQECLNLLYPKVKADGRLIYACERLDCEYSEPAEAPVDPNKNDADARLAIPPEVANTVHARNMIHETEVNLDIVLPDLVEDPALQRSEVDPCPNCGAQEAVFFQAKQNARAETLQLVFICVNCRWKWKDEAISEKEREAAGGDVE